VTPAQVQYIRDRLADWASVPAVTSKLEIRQPGTDRILWTSDHLAHSSRMLSTMVDACESVLGRPEGSADRAWASTFLASLALVWVDEPDWPKAPPLSARLAVVPHNVDACRFCKNPAIRATVLDPDQGDHGWQCAKCGWATVDLGTMHEQVWVCADGLDMVCPGCGAEGEFVDYPQGMPPLTPAEEAAALLEIHPGAKPAEVEIDLFKELDLMADEDDEDD
jgi:hypothetical protein